MTDELVVTHAGRRVGVLRQWSFEYADAWIRGGGWALSTSLPLGRTPFGDLARHWFTNLLPEAGARDRIARRLRIDPHDSFALLVALGGECAGALRLEVPSSAGAPDPQRYRILDASALKDLVEHGPAVAFDGATRLSLAGAQDKIAVRFGPDGELCIPETSAATTHLLKFPSSDDAALVENERLCMELASRVGLRVPATAILHLGEGPVLCVERYDRGPREGALVAAPGEDRDGSLVLPPVERLHQEDFAQALGLPRARKYEDDRGPGLAGIAGNIRRHGLLPSRDLQRLIPWLVFCTAAGNRDNHAKNLAHVLDPESQRWELAPAYDLVNTTAYKRLDRRLAFRIADERQVERLTRAHWSEQAKRLGIAPRHFLVVAQTLVEDIAEQLTVAHDQVGGELGDDARLVQFVRAIRKSISSTRRSLE